MNQLQLGFFPLKLDHNHITDAMTITELKLYGSHSNLSLWLFFSEGSIENNMVAKCINAKVDPYNYKI